MTLNSHTLGSKAGAFSPLRHSLLSRNALGWLSVTQASSCLCAKRIFAIVRYSVSIVFNFLFISTTLDLGVFAVFLYSTFPYC